MSAPEPDPNLGVTPVTNGLPSIEVHADARRRRRLQQLQWRILSGLVLLVVATAAFGPALYGVDPLAQSLTDRLVEIGGRSADGETWYPLGTDALGRDNLARMLVGVRISIFVAVLSVVLGGVLGSLLGLISGFAGGWVDNAIMRLVDVQMSVPFLIFAMVLSAILGPGLRNTIIALGVTSWVIYARVIRSEVLSLRSRDYVDAARALGAGTPRIVLRHIFPNVVNNLTVVSTLEIGRMIIVESSLSFIGLGVQPPNPSLGSMVARGQAYIFNAWWVSTLPGIAILIVVLIIVLFGDALREKLDPRNR